MGEKNSKANQRYGPQGLEFHCPDSVASNKVPAEYPKRNILHGTKGADGSNCAKGFRQKRQRYNSAAQKISRGNGQNPEAVGVHQMKGQCISCQYKAAYNRKHQSKGNQEQQERRKSDTDAKAVWTGDQNADQ